MLPGLLQQGVGAIQATLLAAHAGEHAERTCQQVMPLFHPVRAPGCKRGCEEGVSLSPFLLCSVQRPQIIEGVGHEAVLVAESGAGNGERLVEERLGSIVARLVVEHDTQVRQAGGEIAVSFFVEALADGVRTTVVLLGGGILLLGMCQLAQAIEGVGDGGVVLTEELLLER